MHGLRLKEIVRKDGHSTGNGGKGLKKEITSKTRNARGSTTAIIKAPGSGTQRAVE